MDQWQKSVDKERRRRRARGPRVYLGMLATLLDENGLHSPIVVENVSKNGLLIQSERRLAVQKQYSLVSIYEEPVPVEVVWSRGRFAGAIFKEQVPLLK